MLRFTIAVEVCIFDPPPYLRHTVLTYTEISSPLGWTEIAILLDIVQVKYRELKY